MRQGPCRPRTREAVADAVRGRHTHSGFMASYAQARALVKGFNQSGEEPVFAPWF